MLVTSGRSIANADDETRRPHREKLRRLPSAPRASSRGEGQTTPDTRNAARRPPPHGEMRDGRTSRDETITVYKWLGMSKS